MNGQCGLAFCDHGIPPCQIRFFQWRHFSSHAFRLNGLMVPINAPHSALS